MRFLYTLLLLVATTFLAHSKTIVLTGTIGKYPVTMELNTDDTDCYGRYFYHSALRDIDLAGVFKGSKFRLYVLSPYNDSGKRDTTERLTLSPKNGTEWSGTWRGTRSALLPVSLHISGTAYTSARSLMLHTTVDSTIRRGKLTIAFYHFQKAPVSGITLINGLEGDIINKVNKVLKESTYSIADGYFSCNNNYGTGEYSSEISHFFCTDHLLSLVYSTAYDCGGPHPDEYDRAYNFDLHKGKRLQLPEVLQLTTPVTAAVQPEEDALFLSDVYTEKVMDLLKKLHPEKMANRNKDEQCNYADYTVWQYSTWYFTQNGIFISPDFQHINMECAIEDWSTIPYTLVKKYMGKNSGIVLP